MGSKQGRLSKQTRSHQKTSLEDFEATIRKMVKQCTQDLKKTNKPLSVNRRTDEQTDLYSRDNHTQPQKETIDTHTTWFNL